MEVFIKVINGLVMILEEDKIFMCLAALLYEQFLRIREWRCQDIDQVLLQFDEYDGPSIFENRPKCVPICPVTITLQISATCHGTPTIAPKTCLGLDNTKKSGSYTSKSCN